MSVKSNKSQRKQPAPTLTETMSDHLPTPIGSTKRPSLTKAELTSPIEQQQRHPTSSTTKTTTQPLILINQHQDGTETENVSSSVERSLAALSISQVKLKLSPSTLPLPSTGSYNSLSSAISVSSSSCASINTNNLIKASQQIRVRGWAVKFKNKLILFNK